MTMAAVKTARIEQPVRAAAGWQPVLRYVAVWLPAACLALYAKWALLFSTARNFAGLRAQMDAGDFVSAFRLDFLISFLLVPSVLLVALRPLPRLARCAVAIVVSVLAVVVLYAQMQCLYAIGRFLSPQLAIEALHWFMLDCRSAYGYVQVRSLLKLVISLAWIVFVAQWAFRRDRQGLGSTRAFRRWIHAGACLLCVISAAFWVPRRPAKFYHQDIYSRIWSVTAEDKIDTRAFAGMGAPELMARYRQLTRTPVMVHDPRYRARAAGANVLFFVFETSNSQALPIDGNLDDLPAIRRLRARSFIAPRHFTTYPFTDRAQFSMFSSLYPSTTRLDFIARTPAMVTPGMMRILASRGYDTSIWYPVKFGIEPDSEMFQSLGFKREMVAVPQPAYDVNAPEPERFARDEKTIRAFEEDLKRGVRPFSAAVFPLIGHVPFPNLTGDPHAAPLARMRALLRLQDRWLGQILESLESRGELERTIVIVTADHGIRSTQDDPDFPAGAADDSSYRVPFLMYVPQALRETAVIPWNTSHIDIQPTVLELLGIDAGRAFEQGAPIWDARLSERLLFFFGSHYLGVDAYSDGRGYYSWNHLSNSVQQSPHGLSFSRAPFLAAGSPAYHAAARTLKEMIALQEMLVPAVCGRQ